MRRWWKTPTRHLATVSRSDRLDMSRDITGQCWRLPLDDVEPVHGAFIRVVWSFCILIDTLNVSVEMASSTDIISWKWVSIEDCFGALRRNNAKIGGRRTYDIQSPPWKGNFDEWWPIFWLISRFTGQRIDSQLGTSQSCDVSNGSIRIESKPGIRELCVASQHIERWYETHRGVSSGLRDVRLQIW